MDKDRLKTEIERRKDEIKDYQVNIDNYTRMIDKLPARWPTEMLQFRGKEVADIAASALSEQDMMLAGDLIFRAKLKITLASEKLEQRKTILICNVLEEQL